MLEWEDFTYFTAGDLSGDPGRQSYYDVEAALLKYLTEGDNAPLKDKTITVLKVSHHGSQHSNQKALFEKLKPECVIIPCNQPKKVPSPVFLSRLQEFLVASKKQQRSVTVMFTNSLHVFTQDDRYIPLDAMKTFVAENNVEFKQENNKPHVVSNLGIKAINIRRHKGGNKYQEQLGQDLLKIDMGKYDILMRKRDQNENEEVQKVMRLKTYDMLVPIDILYGETIKVKDEIYKGFEQQADAIVGWRVRDQTEDRLAGKDFSSQFFPGLMKIIENHADLIKFEEGKVSTNDNAKANLKTELVARMKALFEASYMLGTGNQVGLYVRKAEVALNSDEKETLYNLLVNNRYQGVFNTATMMWNAPVSKPSGWVGTEAWNWDWEPYKSVSDEIPAVPLVLRKSKRRLQPIDREEEKQSKPNSSKGFTGT